MRLPEGAAPASWGTSMIRGGGRRDVIPPELLRERLLHGPDLIERRGLEELAVLHHVAGGVGVLAPLPRGSGRPPGASAQVPQWAPIPWSCPWLPRHTFPPARTIFAAPSAMPGWTYSSFRNHCPRRLVMLSRSWCGMKRPSFSSA